VHAFWTNKLEHTNVIFDLRKVKDQYHTALKCKNPGS
jgi:hypothetical protein